MTDWKRYPADLLTKKARAAALEDIVINGEELSESIRGHQQIAADFQKEARQHLLGLLIDDRPVYWFARHTTRTRITQIVEFIVIFHGEPVYISSRIGTVLGRYSVPPAPYSGLVLNNGETPAEVLKQLSQKIGKNLNWKEL